MVERGRQEFFLSSEQLSSVINDTKIRSAYRTEHEGKITKPVNWRKGERTRYLKSK